MSALLDALLGFGSGVLNVLDMPGSYTRGLLAGRPGDRLSGRDMLEEWGFLNENQEGLDAGDVGGFAADVLVDPLNALGGLGIARKLGQIEKANDTSRAMRAAGAMPEEIAALTKAVDESGNPIRLYHGTSDVFDNFDLAKADPKALHGQGFYFTDNPMVASGFAGTSANRRNDILRLVDEAMTEYPRARRLIDEGVPDAVSDLNFARRRGLKEQGRALQYGARPVRENVRMHYLDIRNPLNADEQADLLKTLSVEELPEHGFDSIVGEGRFGFLPNTEVVALDPSQIYLPYIAPALQSRSQVSPLVAALLAYNAGARLN